MNAEPTTVMGTLKPDGVLELDEKLNLPAGRVRVTVESLVESAGETQDPFMARWEAIWARQKARGHVPRSAEEVEAERRARAAESEEELLECERIHREAEEARRRSSQEGRPSS